MSEHILRKLESINFDEKVEKLDLGQFVCNDDIESIKIKQENVKDQCDKYCGECLSNREKLFDIVSSYKKTINYEIDNNSEICKNNNKDCLNRYNELKEYNHALKQGLLYLSEQVEYLYKELKVVKNKKFKKPQALSVINNSVILEKSDTIQSEKK